MQTLKLKAQQGFTFYAAINHNYDNKHCTPENRYRQSGSKSTNQTHKYDA